MFRVGSKANDWRIARTSQFELERTSGLILCPDGLQLFAHHFTAKCGALAKGDMRRREFIPLFYGTAATWPWATFAQPTSGGRRIGVLIPVAEDSPSAQASLDMISGTICGRLG